MVEGLLTFKKPDLLGKLHPAFPENSNSIDCKVWARQTRARNFPACFGWESCVKGLTEALSAHCPLSLLGFQIFCSRCSSHSAPLPRYGQVKPVRVCTHCYMFHVTPFYSDKTGM